MVAPRPGFKKREVLSLWRPEALTEFIEGTPEDSTDFDAVGAASLAAKAAAAAKAGNKKKKEAANAAKGAKAAKEAKEAAAKFAAEYSTEEAAKEGASEAARCARQNEPSIAKKDSAAENERNKFKRKARDAAAAANDDLRKKGATMARNFAALMVGRGEKPVPQLQVRL